MEGLTLAEFHREKDESFRYGHASLLTPEQRQRFDGLRYFLENPALRLLLPLGTDVPDDMTIMPKSLSRTYQERTLIRFPRPMDNDQPATASPVKYLRP